MPCSLTSLSEKIGYTFNDKALLLRAVTHRSFSTKSNYERLEFFGDSILNFVISEALCRQFPGATEGQLSRLRASLVKGKTLANVAREIDLSEHLVMSPAEMKRGGYKRDSVLADSFEAIIGAIYKDSGMPQCQAFIMEWFRERLEKLCLDSMNKDPKTQLQEFVQKCKMALPEYHIVSTEGEAHNQIFNVRCDVKDKEWSTKGRGETRRKAEQLAAKAMMDRFNQALPD